MNRVAVFSGKGGTGKTTVVAMLARMQDRVVAVDADVDAANLALLLPGVDGHTVPFSSGQKASILAERCDACGACADVCRFDAIRPGQPYQVDPLACEGCRACVFACPVRAIRLQDNVAGSWTVRRLEGEKSWLVHAALGVAQDNSGKLVARVRERADALAIERGIDLVLVDGPPGIGCPVHAAMTGVDRILVVTEPTVSGAHDLVRLLELARHFAVPAYVVINKADLHPPGREALERMCAEREAPVIGQLPFDPEVPRLLALGQVPETGPFADAVRRAWEEVKAQPAASAS